MKLIQLKDVGIRTENYVIEADSLTGCNCTVKTKSLFRNMRVDLDRCDKYGVNKSFSVKFLLVRGICLDETKENLTITFMHEEKTSKVTIISRDTAGLTGFAQKLAELVEQDTPQVEIDMMAPTPKMPHSPVRRFAKPLSRPAVTTPPNCTLKRSVISPMDQFETKRARLNEWKPPVEYESVALAGPAKKHVAKPSQPIVSKQPLFSDRGGLVNTGNNCYANAVLQCLVRQRGFVNAIEERKTLVPMEYSAFVKAFLRVSRHVKGGSQRTLDATNVKDLVASNEHASENAKRFGNKAQQDAHEFLVYLLTTFEGAFGEEFVREFFESRITQKILCTDPDCGHAQVQEQKVLDLQVDIPYDNQETSLSISQLLGKTFRRERIDDYSCEKCKGKGAIKRLQITKLAPIVIVQIKRFTFDNKKKNDAIEVDQMVKIKDHYLELNSVVFHSGNSMGFGHYTATAKEGETWTSFDDSKVTKGLTVDSVLKKLANQRNTYLAIYMKA